MFCPKCGTENDNSAMFCGNCGTNLSETMNQNAAVDNNATFNMEQPVQLNNQGVDPNQAMPVNNMAMNQGMPANNMAMNQGMQYQNSGMPMTNSQPGIKLSGGVLAAIIAAAVLIVAIVVFVVVGNNLSNPEKIAKEYFENVAAAEWEKVYEYYDFSETDFVNKKMYTKAVKDKKKIEYSNYEIRDSYTDELEELSDIIKDSKEKTKKDDSIYETYYIKYADKNGDSTGSIYTVKLVKAKNKKLLFFDNWKVVPEDMLSKDFTIRTLKSFAVTVDGKKLTDKYLAKSDGDSDEGYNKNYAVYKIPAVFKGSHDLKFKSDIAETHDYNINITTSTSEYYSFVDPEVKESVKEEVNNKAKEIINTMYQSAIEDKNYSELKLEYKINEDSKDEIEDEYEDLMENVDKTSYSWDISVKKLNIKEFKISNESSYVNMGNIHVSHSFEMEYEGEFHKKDSDKDEKETDTGKVYGRIQYEYIDGEWQITDINPGSIYKSWY